ncbi:GNAT family N-acetyltransferase [Nodosilinea sp. LEGE 06152]|uniref:GNAT family N-acetyltransferase n=1 Tax=Nodosilinea sp. LEGE 06152 TaxID=2777966 RepID=UPI001D151492|nr:GNAT family N-acetyltransferase [Nodosilinea sp. LEGE 06152]
MQMLSISVRQATLNDLLVVSDILDEAAAWLKQQNMALWEKEEVSPEAIRQDVEAGLFYMAFVEDGPAGVVKFQLEDPMFWSDISQDDSAFIHRLAVRRCFAGGNVSIGLMKWAVKQSRDLGKRFLRLDCAADRLRLRRVYESFGFRHHSDRQVGPYFVARYEYKV